MVEKVRIGHWNTKRHVLSGYRNLSFHLLCLVLFVEWWWWKYLFIINLASYFNANDDGADKKKVSTVSSNQSGDTYKEDN